MIAVADFFETGWFRCPPGLEFVPSHDCPGIAVDTPLMKDYQGRVRLPRIDLIVGRGGNEQALRAKMVRGFPVTKIPQWVIESLDGDSPGSRAKENGRSGRQIELAFQLRGIDHTVVAWTSSVLVWDRSFAVLGESGFFEFFHVVRDGGVTRLAPREGFVGAIGAWRFSS